MAEIQNNLRLKNAQIYLNEEDGKLYATEVSKDYTETFCLNDLLLDFAGDDRFVNLAVNEKVILEGDPD